MTDHALDAIGPRLGEGEFPDELDRLNWGALLLPGLWALIYGSLGWFFIFLVAGIAILPVMFFALYADLPPHVVFAMLLVASAATESLAVVFATKANRSVWERECRRVARESDQSVPRPAQPLVKYVESQRTWALCGLILLAISNGSSLLALVTGRSPLYYGASTAVGLAVPATLFVLERQRLSESSRS